MRWHIVTLVTLLGGLLVIGWYTSYPVNDGKELGNLAPAPTEDKVGASGRQVEDWTVKVSDLEQRIEENSKRLQRIDNVLRKQQGVVDRIKDIEQSYDSGKIDSEEYVRRRKEL